METNEHLPTADPPRPTEEKRTLKTSISTMYVGSFPPPEILDAYERHSPGAASRFIEMVENEQRMQFAIANRKVDLREAEDVAATTNFRLGLAASFILMLVLFAFMFVCAYRGLNDALMYALSVPVLTTISAIINQFIGKRKSRA